MNNIIAFFKKLWASIFGSNGADVAPTPHSPPVVVSPIEVSPIVVPPVVIDADVEQHGRFSAPESEAEFVANERHVVAVEGGWAIKASHDGEPLELHATKKAAVASAKAMCKADKGELFVHAKDGKIQDRMSYGHDAPKRHG